MINFYKIRTPALMEVLFLILNSCLFKMENITTHQYFLKTESLDNIFTIQILVLLLLQLLFKKYLKKDLIFICNKIFLIKYLKVYLKMPPLIFPKYQTIKILELFMKANQENGYQVKIILLRLYLKLI